MLTAQGMAQTLDHPPYRLFRHDPVHLLHVPLPFVEAAMGIIRDVVLAVMPVLRSWRPVTLWIDELLDSLFELFPSPLLHTIRRRQELLGTLGSVVQLP